MKFTKNWKRFWTLNAHHDAGFTLVELIIVIAILAILAGVAVPAYSGYITQANKSNVKTLVGDVANALLLYAYAHPTEQNSGYVVLSTSGAQANAIGTNAMLEAYGSNWPNNKLSYGEWADDGLLGSVIGNDFAASVPGSSFLQGSTTTQLLNDAASLTGSALKFLTNFPDNMLYAGMCGQLADGDNTSFNKLCEQYGIEIAADGESFVGPIDDTFRTKLANFIVLASANNISNVSKGDAEPVPAAYIVLTVSTINAFINSSYATETDKVKYNEMLDAMKNISDPNEIEAAMSYFTAYDPADPDQVSIVMKDYLADTALTDKDGDAFYGIMQAVDKVGSNLNSSDLSNINLFSPDGKAAGYFNTFVTAAQAKGELDAMFPSGIPAGTVVVFLSFDSNGEPVVSCSTAELLAK